ncbi:MAG TPA: TIGR03032 family protein [Thermoanaerobaculia bacterium]
MDLLDAPWGFGLAEAPGVAAFYSRSLAALLAERNATLLVSSMPAGKLMIVCAGGADTLSIQAVPFARISGVAFDGGDRLAIASVGTQVWFLERAEPDRFRLRSTHETGEIASHEIAWGADGLWVVNTRYSCLCTLEPGRSFTPRWQPPFVTELLPEDRCHLNGVAMVGGAPKYVTCFSRTDTASGWRSDPAGNGCLIDVPSSAVVATGLTMPHSPRVHDGRVFVLDSGTGRLVTVDAGRVTPVARFDGFVRGLAFSGPLAFVGVSKTRHLKVGLPLVEELGEGGGRCGVWVVDAGDGRGVGFLELVAGVDEVFDVQVLHGMGRVEV